MVHIIVDYSDDVVNEVVNVSALNTENDTEVDITDFFISYCNGDAFIEQINWHEIYHETKKAYYEI